MIYVIINRQHRDKKEGKYEKIVLFDCDYMYGLWPFCM